jgi:sigma-B regulation protein RsbU (phosphoserine phosphatase)
MSTNPPLPAPGAVDSLEASLLRVLMETSPDRIYFKDRESRFVRNSHAHALSLGAASPEECIGRTDFDYFAREHAERAFADEQEIIRTGRPVIAKVERLTRRDGTQGWASSTKMPWRDGAGRIIGTFGLTRDITAAKEAEERLNEERILLRTIIDHLPSRLYVKDTASRYVLNNRAHLASLGAAAAEDVRGRTTLDFYPGERGRQALADDQQVLGGGPPIINQEKSDFGPAGDVHWSLVTKVLLRDARDQVVGLVGISHDITRRKRAEEELRRRSAEMEADLVMARQVQEAFLHRAPPFFPGGRTPGESALRCSHRYLPTTTLGGDFFTLLRLGERCCGLLVCDVMGHGVRAGLLTALLRGVVEEMGSRAGEPTHVLREINRSLMPIVEQTGQPVFATVFFGVIDLDRLTLVYSNAGHPPPLLRAADGTIRRLAPEDPEPAAGLLGDFGYSRHEVPFPADSTLLAYTDGVFEAANAAGEFFGVDRLRATLATATAGAVIPTVLDRVRAHCGRSEFEDDVCLVCLEADFAAPAAPA